MPVVEVKVQQGHLLNTPGCPLSSLISPSKLPMAVAALKEPELTAACNLLLSGWSWHSSICNLRSLNNPVSKIIVLASLCKEHIIRAALTISVEIALAASC